MQREYGLLHAFLANRSVGVCLVVMHLAISYAYRDMLGSVNKLYSFAFSGRMIACSLLLHCRISPRCTVSVALSDRTALRLYGLICASRVLPLRGSLLRSVAHANLIKFHKRKAPQTVVRVWPFLSPDCDKCVSHYQ